MVITDFMSDLKREIKKEIIVVKGEMHQGMFNRTLILNNSILISRKHIQKGRTIYHSSLEICYNWYTVVTYK